MSQSYVGYINDNGKVKLLSPHMLNCGDNLTEFGQMGSAFTTAILREIMDAPKKVAIIGEYADTDALNLGDANMDDFIEPTPLGMTRIEDFSGWCLLNHDKREYIDINKYVNKNARVLIGEYELDNGQKRRDMDVFCMSPIALLTACGNGRDRGDYFGSDMHMVGRWALDTIEFRKLSYLAISGFAMINPRFIDNWVDGEAED